MNQDLETFHHLSQPRLQTWLEAEKLKAMAGMTAAAEPMVIYRYQGQVLVLQKMLDLLEKSRNLR